MPHPDVHKDGAQSERTIYLRLPVSHSQQNHYWLLFAAKPPPVLDVSIAPQRREYSTPSHKYQCQKGHLCIPNAFDHHARRVDRVSVYMLQGSKQHFSRDGDISGSGDTRITEH